MSQQEKAKSFRAMHQTGQVLVLPNCWDAISARVMRHAGAKAIATASASISWARGVCDGEALTRDEMLDAVAVVCRSVDLPVSADMEKGYGDTPEAVGETIAGAIDAGAIGINIEDSLPAGGQRDIPEMQERIGAARKAGVDAGVDIYINARADGYLLGLKGDEAFEGTVERGRAWLAAGADCVFVPGVADVGILGKLVKAIGGPVSVIVMDEHTPGVAQLRAAGVTRISTGPRPMQFVAGTLHKAVESIYKEGDFRFMKGVPRYDDVEKF